MKARAVSVICESLCRGSVQRCQQMMKRRAQSLIRYEFCGEGLLLNDNGVCGCRFGDRSGEIVALVPSV